MPDGPRYDDDFFAWTQYQAEVLRTLPTSDPRFDRENVVEEVEALGRNYRADTRSVVERILIEFLKLANSPARAARFCSMGLIVEYRAQLDDRLSPSLRRDIEEQLPRLYALARKRASVQLQRLDTNGADRFLPPECPYSLQQILVQDWYPEPAGPEEKSK